MTGTIGELQSVDQHNKTGQNNSLENNKIQYNNGND